MHDHQSFKELKAAARKSLEGNYGHAISLFITTELLSLLPAYIVLFLFSGNSLFNNICSEIVSFILSVFLQVLHIGVCLFYMKIQCNQQANISDLFYGFKSNTNTFFKLGLLFAAISTATNLPALVLSYISEDLILIYCALLGGILVNFLLVVPIRQSSYILLDFPDSTTKQALLMSIRIMKKHYWRYVMLILSFIPLILICFLCCGVGLLWVTPYMNATLTALYFDLIRHNKNTQSKIDIHI